MSLLLIEPLIGATSSAVASVLWDVVRDYVKEKSKRAAPAEIRSEQDIQAAASVIEEADSQASESESNEITVRALSSAHANVDAHRLERLKQARLTFRAALILSILGILLIFSGVALVLFADHEFAGAITAAVGAVTEVVSAVIFRLNHETNNRLDEIGRDMRVIEAAQISMTLIAKIEDQKTRDEAIRDAARDLRMLAPRAAS